MGEAGVHHLAQDGGDEADDEVAQRAQDQKQADAKLSAASQSVGGPLSIFGILFPAAERAGARYVVMITALISLTLAVMNILPIPALDGGRWFVTAVFRLLKKPLTKEREEKIHGTGFLVFIVNCGASDSVGYGETSMKACLKFIKQQAVAAPAWIFGIILAYFAAIFLTK